jgi:hypothetical protein
MVRAYHRANGELDRDEVLVPDSSHGTNPATASMAGFRTITIPSATDGGVDVDAFRAALGPKTAAVMITNPSTLGLFEKRIGELLQAVHEAGALAYMDGANLNAILGRFKPGEAGFDVMHFNVHKTFSTPHGGGGPGAGPVGVGEKLLPYLPMPRVLREDDGTFRLERPDERPTSIGRLRSFVGNTGVLVRAYTYLRAHGGSGLRQVTRSAADESLPSWSRDGRFIYFGSNRTGRHEIWRVGALGGVEEQVTHEGGCIPVESLDGGTLYYRRTCFEGRMPVLARPTAGGAERTILKCVDGLSFAVDARGVFHVDCDSEQTLRLWEAATGKDRAVGTFDEEHRKVGLSVSPDGRSIVYARTLQESDLVMIENFR